MRSSLKKQVIYRIENLTGRKALLRLTRGVEEEFEDCQNFWKVMCGRFNVTINVFNATPQTMTAIPKTGPVLIVVNHPNGVLDGLVIGQLLQSVRPDFKILAQSVFMQVDALAPNILPVSFGETDDATKINLQTRKDAINHLKDDGCICVFPAGGVSTSLTPFGKAKDTRWRNFTAKLLAVPDVQVVPIYIAGQNSRLFQIVSHISDTLRKAMLLYEFKRRLGSAVQIAVGQPLQLSDWDADNGDPVALMQYLYQQTYGLAPLQAHDDGYGFEFDKRYR